MLVAVAVLLAAFTPPPLTGRVVDAAGVFSAADAAQLEQELARFQAQTGHQLVVVVVDRLDGASVEEAALQTAEQWRLGDKARDDGMLFFVATGDRRVRVEVGYGLEGVVTDVVASRVLREVVVPRFVAGDLDGGIVAGARALARAAGGDVGAVVDDVPAPASSPDPWSGLGVVALLLLFLSALFARLPRPARAVVLGVAGAAGAFGLTGSFPFVGLGVVAGVVLGVLPAQQLWLWRRGFGGRFGGRGGGGGFSGGGGGFGGGGASGKW